jgi:hypothetical protein
MGGFGSGNWLGRDAKATVEDSLSFAVKAFRGRLFDGAAGSFIWYANSPNPASIGYTVSQPSPDDWPIITLRYRWNGREDVEVPIRMQTTPPQFGGRRWWFTCPLARDGVACNRRVAKLYCPSGAQYFGCRTCHDLTYSSCQNSHRSERLYESIAAMLGYEAGFGRQVAKALG